MTRAMMRRATRFLLPRRPGLTVAVIGPDGSGKTTLASELPRRLPVRARMQYMGIYGRPAPRLRGLGALVRLSRIWIGGAVARWHRAHGSIVVFDRYGHDAMLPEGGSLLTRSRRWLFRHAAPDPDLVFLLDAPAELLSERKQEQTLAELQDQRMRYRGLVHRVPGLIMVDASTDAEQVAREVADTIWRRYTSRLSARE